MIPTSNGGRVSIRYSYRTRMSSTPKTRVPVTMIIDGDWESAMLMARRLGSQGLQVSAIGLGCLGMSQSYGTPDDEESIATIHCAVDLGVTLFDTAEAYGPFKNEELLGRALKGRRDQA